MPGCHAASRSGPAPPPIVLVPCDRGRLQSISPPVFVLSHGAALPGAAASGAGLLL